VAQVVLSHLLAISALVSRYLTNKLIARELRPGQRTFDTQKMPPVHVVWYYPSVRMAIPIPRVDYPRITAPFATSPSELPRWDSFDLHA
jgi:hypothetical protein